MKILFLSFSLFVSCSIGFSQSFINGIGIAVISTGGTGFSSFVTGGITYSPRVNISESDHSSISIGIPLSIGLSTSTTDASGAGTASVMLNVPLLLNFNMGCGATRESDEKFGFFAGGGLGYHLAAYANTYGNTGNNADGTTTVNAFGPVANAGVRIGVGHGYHNIEIKLTYMKGLDVTKANVIGGACLFNF